MHRIDKKKPHAVRLVLLAGLCLFPVALVGCEEEGDSLFDPNFEEGTPPVVESITPADSAFAGDTLTITGQNFVAEVNDNFVYFKGTEAEILEASPTELTIVAPDMVGQDIPVRAAVMGAVDFSNTVLYDLVERPEESAE